MILHYYREKAGMDRREADAHLASCEICRRELAALAESLEGVAAAPTPERGENYGAEVWARIRPQLDESRARRCAFFLPLRIWALAAAGLAALLIGAFWGGRVWQQRQTPTVAAISVPARQRILMVAVGDHLERAQMLLVEVMNQEGEGTVDETQTRRFARDLVQSNRLYRQTALRDGDPGVANVLDDLERVLLNISNGPKEISADDLTSLKRQIESQGILFKIRVVELGVREKQKGAEAQPRRQPL